MVELTLFNCDRDTNSPYSTLAMNWTLTKILEVEKEEGCRERVQPLPVHVPRMRLQPRLQSIEIEYRIQPVFRVDRVQYPAYDQSIHYTQKKLVIDNYGYNRSMQDTVSYRIPWAVASVCSEPTATSSPPRTDGICELTVACRNLETTAELPMS